MITVTSTQAQVTLPGYPTDPFTAISALQSVTNRPVPLKCEPLLDGGETKSTRVEAAADSTSSIVQDRTPQANQTAATSQASCLLTLETDHVQNYHIIPKTLPGETAFVQGLWALVPQDIEVVENLYLTSGLRYDLTDAKKFYDGETTFKYIFLPLEGMDICIKRRDLQGNSASRQHFSPYDEFPIITSHILPHVVIYDFVQKISQHLEELEVERYDILLKTHPHLAIILSKSIYMKWMKRIPPPAWYRNHNTSTDSCENKDNDDEEDHDRGNDEASEPTTRRRTRTRTRTDPGRAVENDPVGLRPCQSWSAGFDDDEPDTAPVTPGDAGDDEVLNE
ncbi:hypothetical protein H0H81_006429, partial [Sphagnurus paluster]